MVKSSSYMKKYRAKIGAQGPGNLNPNSVENIKNAINQYMKNHNGNVPESVYAPNRETRVNFYKAAAQTVNLPEDLQEYMTTSYENGHPHFQVLWVNEGDKSDTIRLSAGSNTWSVLVPSGLQGQERREVMEGAVKMSLLRWWNREDSLK